jgi:peptidoglycan-N-acetylglucosamine deacetylase
MPKASVTTSWDDGHSTDLRIAELLSAYALKGTFYVAFNHPKTKEISDAEIRALHRLGMEIGSHTLTHRMLTGRPLGDIRYEMSESKKRLEDIVGAPVTAFSYPQGAYSAAARHALAETGSTIGRSTAAFRTGRDFDPLLMPISVEFCRASRTAIARHALRDGNVAGLLSWWRIGRLETHPVALSRRLFDAALANGGVFHLNARSWEIDKSGLWQDLENAIGYVAGRPGVHYATNSDAALQDDRDDSAAIPASPSRGGGNSA